MSITCVIVMTTLSNVHWSPGHLGTLTFVTQGSDNCQNVTTLRYKDRCEFRSLSFFQAPGLGHADMFV